MPKATNFPWFDFTSFVPQWETQADKYSLTENRKVHARKKIASTNADDAADRGGVSFLQNAETSNPMKRSLWMESKQMFGYLDSIGQPHPPNVPYAGEQLSPDTWRGFATSFPLVGFEEDEFLEGECNCRNESGQYLAFKQKRAEMYAAAGLPNNTYLSYGAFSILVFSDWKVQGVANSPTSNLFRQYYSSQSAAQQIASAYFSLLWSSNPSQIKTWPNLKYYPETPYTSRAFYWNKMTCELLMQGMDWNGFSSYVASDLIESLGDSTVPEGATHGNCPTARHVPNPSGKALGNVHPQWDYDQQRAHYFIMGLCIMNRIAAWDHGGQRGTDPNTIWNAQGGDVETVAWQSDNGAPPPYGNPGYSPNRLNWYDYCLCGATWLYKQCAATAGTRWRYVRYKVGSGEWIDTKIDGSDILFHAEAKRGDCMGRVVGNNVSYYYYNPSLQKNQFEVITVDIGGRQFANTLQGGVLHVFNETL